MLIQYILLLSLAMLLATAGIGIHLIRMRNKPRLPVGLLMLFALMIPPTYKLYLLNFTDQNLDLVWEMELAGLAASALMLALVRRFENELREGLVTQQTLQSDKQSLESRIALHTLDLQTEAAERERVTRALLQSEDRMRLVVQNLPVMVVALNHDNQYVIWNRESERVTGYSAAEMVQNPAAFELLFPDPDYRKWLSDYTTKHPRFRDLELTMATQNDGERIVAWSNVSDQFPVPGWAVWAMGIDITQRKLATIALHEIREKLELQVAQRTQELRTTNEQLQNEVTQRQRAEIALRQSQNQLRTTLDTLNDLVYVVDANLRITLVNERFRAWNQELAVETQPIGRTLLELFPFFSDKLNDEYQQVFATGDMLITEETQQVGTLSLVTETRKIPVFENGTITHVVTVARDITERKQIEAALARERNLLNTMVNHLPACIYVKDADGRFVLANDTLLRTFGLTTQADIIGLTNFDLSAPTRAEQIRASEQQIIASGIPLLNEEQTTVGVDGSTQTTLISKLPLKDPQGTVTGLVGIELDITGLQHAQAQALKFAIEKERSTLLTRFIRDISHEFANPFSVIKNSAYLAHHVPNPDKRKHYLELINGQIFHLEKLVEGMLLMSRIDSGVPLEQGIIDFQLTLSVAQTSLADPLTEKSLTLVTDFAGTAPNTLPDDFPTLAGDPHLMQTALHNVLENAILYTPDEGKITLRARHTPNQIILEVTDTGIGIAPDDLPHIFERFYRVNKARTERGAGLGLPIARAIIERHGGTLTAASQFDRGSTFRIELPLTGTPTTA